MLLRPNKNKSTTRVFSLLALALVVVGLAFGGALNAFAGKLSDTTYGLSGHVPSAPYANMVVNGDFETGSLSPLTTATNGGRGARKSTPAFVHAGLYSGRVIT